jgi:hypothetical protein
MSFADVCARWLLTDLAETKLLLELMESGVLKTGECRAGEWVDTTLREIDRRKNTIVTYEHLLSRSEDSNAAMIKEITVAMKDPEPTSA